MEASEKNDEITALHCLAVDPFQKNKGYGKAFVSFYENYAKEQGCTVLRMDTNAKNAKAVKIGNNVWIGAGVHINQGVTIGDNTIIGSGSVVTKDIPSNVVAVGVPCKVSREITEADKTGYRPY